jgi:Cu+-exporting ATPase
MAMMNDPVCGMQIDSSQAPAQSQYQGQTYYFCSVECKQKFDANPKKFATAA